MSIIYEPRGKAKEYSELAANLYTGCCHACTYCYCPSIMRKTLEDWSNKPVPRKNVIYQLAKECQAMKNDEREILLSFMSDPYQSEEAASFTRSALELFEQNNLRCQILTKGGMKASDDFEIMAKNKWKFAQTILFVNDAQREKYEPYASETENRFEALKAAFSMGIETWVSMEPVINTKEALKVIDRIAGICHKVKLGRWNYDKRANEINWSEFGKEAIERLNANELNYYIKDDLWKLLDADTKERHQKEKTENTTGRI